MGTTRRRLLQALGIAGTSALAGCTDSNTTTQRGATETPTETPPGVDGFAYPDGFDADGITDPDAAIETQKAFVNQFSSFTSTLTVEYRREGEVTGTTLSEIAASRPNESVFWEYEDHAHDKEIYFNGDSLLVFDEESAKVIAPDQTALFGGDPPEGFAAVSQYHERELLQSFVESFEFAATDVTRLERGIAVTFDVSGLSGSAAEYYDSATGEMVVLQDGGILNMELNTTREEDGATEETTNRYELSGFEDTVVEEPEWLQS